MNRLFLLAALFAVSACDSAGSDPFVAQPVVSAFLEADASFPDVRVTRTVALGDVYDPATAAIVGAAVRIERLAADSTVDGTVPYVYDAERRVYVPDGARPGVEPGRTYRLVVTALGREMTAETTVPQAIGLVEGPPAEIGYQSNPGGPSVRITTSSVAGRQSVYIASTLALAPDAFTPFQDGGATRFRSQNLPGRFRPVPIVRQFLDCDDVGGALECDEDPTDAAAGTSPVINETSYTLLPDGTALVNVPWLAFGFYGPAALSLVALDDALLDFVETQTLQQNPTTISPGEIPNVTTNVRGGLGVFGSFSRVTAQTTVLER